MSYEKEITNELGDTTKFTVLIEDGCSKVVNGKPIPLISLGVNEFGATTALLITVKEAKHIRKILKRAIRWAT